MQQALDRLRVALGGEATTSAPLVIQAVNAHICNMAGRDADLADRLNCSGLLLADGMSIVWASRLLRRPLSERCNLTEFFRLYLEAEMPAAMAVLVGCGEEDARAAAEAIHAGSKHCRILETMDGYRSEAFYRNWLRSRPEPIDMLLVGMGTPRSEALIALARDVQAARVICHIGGGTVRFLAGTDAEAPQWLRRIGLQWLHRLLLHPSMWRRYLLGNPRFARLVFQQYCRERSASAAGGHKGA